MKNNTVKGSVRINHKKKFKKKLWEWNKLSLVMFLLIVLIDGSHDGMIEYMNVKKNMKEGIIKRNTK